MKISKIALIFFLVACDSKFNEENIPKYLPLTGGQLSGNLDVSTNLSVFGKTSINEFSCTGCINSNSILDGSIGTADIATSSITSAKILDSSIMAADIAASAITSAAILNGSIATDDIADKAITVDKIDAGSANYSLVSLPSGDVGWLPPQIQYGIKFEYLNSSSIRLIPVGINNVASILVSNGTELRSVLISSSLTANLALSGAGGLDNGAKAPSTGYDVYLVTQNSGANPALLFTASGGVPTMPLGYTFISEILWFVSNTYGVGNNSIVPFVDVGGGGCHYLIERGVLALNDGENTVNTAINFTSTMPTSASLAKLWVVSWNLDLLTPINFRLTLDPAGSLDFFSVTNIINVLGVGNKPISRRQLDVAINGDIAASLYYSFSATPLIGDFGANIYVQGWTLPSRMSR